MKKLQKILLYICYWILQCTWGIVMTFIGACAAAGLILTGHKPKTLGPNVYFEVGENWGGVSLGGFFICDKHEPMSTKYHECGHGLQNIIFGPLMPFLVCLPSAARYWLFNFKSNVDRAVFVASLLGGSAVCFTLLAWLMTFTGVKGLVMASEILRLYFVLLSLWLSVRQMPKFENGIPDYDSVWFEHYATEWGTQVYGKKEG